MISTLHPLLFLTLMVVADNAQRVDVSSDVRALVTAEHNFAKAVETNGIKNGFLAYLASEAILFRPGPVNGVEWMKTRPASTGWLGWEPVFADASRSGDLGYTTGPWSFRAKGVKDTPSAFGEYITLWKKQPDATWKVVFDGGISHPQPKSQAKSTRPGAMTSGGRVLVRPSSDPDSARAEVLALEQTLGKSVSGLGLARAYEQLGSPDLRMFREGAYPLVGTTAVRGFLEASSARPTWTPTQSYLSSATDLAYVIGSYENSSVGESGAYLRIWKRGGTGGWKIVLDLASPAPPTGKS